MTTMKMMLKKTAAQVLASASMLLPCAASQAQDLLPDAQRLRTLACLVKPAEAPKYPDGDLKDKGVTAFMRLKLRFEAPDRAPVAELMSSDARTELQRVAFEHVSRFRLPCMASGQAPLTASIEFIFDPYSQPLEKSLRLIPDNVRREDACLVMPSEPMDGDFSSRSGGVPEGVHRVYVQATFKGDGSQPPEVKVLHAYADRAVSARVLAYVREYRMPCRTAGSEPVDMSQMFVYTLNAKTPPGFRYDEMDLATFLRVTTAPSRKERAYFDMDSMACPFKLKWTLTQPLLPNGLREVGEPDPGRAEFLAWLAERTMNLDANATRLMFGQSMKIQVPCGKLDLNAPAASS